MPFRMVIRTRPLNWSSRKWTMMVNDIGRLLAQEGAPGSEIIREEIGEEPAKQAQATFLHLACSKCEVDWYAESFQTCTGCGGRKTISKLQKQRVVYPKDRPEGPQPLEAKTADVASVRPDSVRERVEEPVSQG